MGEQLPPKFSVTFHRYQRQRTTQRNFYSDLYKENRYNINAYLWNSQDSWVKIEDDLIRGEITIGHLKK